ncbi:MAG TPA: hypothetical protein VHB20_14505 [Verrucomicrobiae bacterium]|jgi:hypothetical protein|nr:hypothetical protein [Verrucomicrobiae bacterium]
MKRKSEQEAAEKAEAKRLEKTAKWFRDVATNGGPALGFRCLAEAYLKLQDRVRSQELKIRSMEKSRDAAAELISDSANRNVSLLEAALGNRILRTLYGDCTSATACKKPAL